ncbi:MAG: hypothetical protein AAGB02_03765 [Pseudomonadota bacterium]
MSLDRKQSPHYIPELDPEVNGTDEGAVDLARESGVTACGAGLALIIVGAFGAIQTAVVMGAVALTGGVAALLSTGSGQNSR